MGRARTYRVVEAAMPEAEVDLAAWLRDEAKMEQGDGWEFDDDGQPVQFVGPKLEGVAAALYGTWLAHDRDDDTAEQATAERELHRACLGGELNLARVRRATNARTLLVRVAEGAARTESEIVTRGRSLLASTRRAYADLASRLHGLVHACLLAARVSTAQAVAVTSQ